MPLATSPNGAKPMPSRLALLRKLMNTWVVRVSGEAPMAKVMKPFLLLCVTLSGGMRAVCHTFDTFALPLRPNCTMKLGTARKNRTSS